MISATLPALARTHRDGLGPRLTVEGFVRDYYRVDKRFFARVATGKKKPSAKLLRALSQAHVRLFPSDPVLLTIPNHPPVLLGHIPQN